MAVRCQTILGPNSPSATQSFEPEKGRAFDIPYYGRIWAGTPVSWKTIRADSISITPTLPRRRSPVSPEFQTIPVIP
ncbi:hypothetical protein BDW74DRAFT_141397 [Aspergillus multicolor]|uniref:uncharacterized protein n=1 Tax=Aspergillus multicolor TaxID=41759 RepID=UPI003CCD60B6